MRILDHKQCGLQKLNNEGMHVVQNESHTYFINNYVHQNAIIVSSFEGIKANFHLV